jgi:tRNA uridine 5-carboxymethylaminomethyl modification enzyme
MRLDKHTIEWDHFTPEPGDKKPVPFSFRTQKDLENKILCYSGYTNQNTHKVINKNLDKSPLYSGKIVGIGPRYCPSIEDKVVKFPERLRHQFFLEPEGLETSEIYVNGLSSSLPLKVQKDVLKSISGLDQAKILRPAYGIEYDAVIPTQLHPSLETRLIENLFLAGQINGTSGYEEAAAQGLMAGINAGLKVKKKKPFILRRDEAYIGVLIDDLITQGVEEPYRLFTSRAEYRLSLRIDNADKRLTPYGYKIGLIDEKEHEAFLKKQEKINKAMNFLRKETIPAENKETLTLWNFLKKPEVKLENVVEYKKISVSLSDEEMRHVESEVKYEGYLKKQEKEIAKIRKVDGEKIRGDTEFKNIPGLTREVIEKLEEFKPRTIGEAKVIPGMTPAATMNLHVYMKIQKKKGQDRRNVPRGTLDSDE